MSWAEVYKINSDIQGEPLNFLNYLQDLKLNGSESYILYEGNHRIWEELYLNSLYLFSDRGIREVVYTAFSETDIDNLFDKSTKLGEQLNAFYRTDIFSLGNADNVVKGMTVEHYNSLEEKFKAGYDRYVRREQEKSTIGLWFNSTFSLNNTDLESLTTIDEILANTEATNAILNNSNAIVALTMCKSSMDAVVANPNAMDLLGQYILKVTVEPTVIKAILKNNVIREAIINSNDAMKQIATNANSVIELLKNLEAVKLLNNNKTPLEIMLTNEDIAKEIFPKIIGLKTLLTTINIYTTTIQNNIEGAKPTINSTTYKNQTFPLLTEIKENYEIMENDKNSTVENSTYILDIINNIINNLSIMRVIIENTLSINSITTNSHAMNAVANSSTAMNAVINSSTAMNAVANSSTAMNAVANSSTAMNAVINSSTAMNAVINSSTAMNAVANSSTAMNAVANSSTAMNKITSTPFAFNRVVKSNTAKSILVNKNGTLQTYKANIHSTLKNTSYFSVITNEQNSDNPPSQVINNAYVGVTYCYGYSSGTGRFGVVYHGYNTSIEAGRGDGAKDENKKFITLGGAKYTQEGDGYFTYSMYQAI
ncbi:phage tail protein [Clostridioides sp. ZZV15-6388]|uniref:phage tail protein n=2 Tax=unclassified Clostridioides TaxID=2635829 RepID=UPI001D12A3A6|nr:phage tail protein [Clostridioides sp. ZZV15-6388]